MKLGLLVPSIMSNSLTGFYNLQEMGLIRAFDKLGVEAIAYRLVDEKKEFEELKIPGTKSAVEYFLPSMRIGTNGMVDLKLIDKSIDALICFTDTQLDVPRIFKWARLNNIPFYSYVGVVESHSDKRLKRFFMNIISNRNTKVHKASVCFVKTPYVGELLKNKGVRHIVEAPVGLDEETLKKDYASYDRDELRSRYGYEKSDKIILFVGRLEEEKRPLDMMRIFKRLLQKDPDFRLLMVGKGSLENEVIKEAESLKDKIKLIDALPNSEMWILYRLSDVFVNLNKGEIFGMS
ncbi:MAG: glycosyltransferase, partial [Lachnospiraceae bacterium]|nr:glycosyltransferase [Lachnospiraceae bacterium]